jgi:hypothetical protein
MHAPESARSRHATTAPLSLEEQIFILLPNMGSEFHGIAAHNYYSVFSGSKQSGKRDEPG